MFTRLLSDDTDATADGRLPDPAPPDGGERRLAWIAAWIAVGAVVVLGATLSTLPPVRDRADVSASTPETVATAVPDALSAPTRTPPPSSADRASTGPGTATSGDVVAPSTVASTAPRPTRPHAKVRPRANATTAPAPVTGLPPNLQAAIAAVRAAIQRQISTGQLDPYAGAELLGIVDQVARELSASDWTAAADYASTIWEKLGVYREQGKVTTSGYQTLVAAFENARASVANQ